MSLRRFYLLVPSLDSSTTYKNLQALFVMKKVNWWNVVLEVVRVLIAALSGAGAATMM